MDTATSLRRLAQSVRHACYGPIARLLRAAMVSVADDTAEDVGLRLGRAAYRLAPNEAHRTRRHLTQAFPEKTSDDVDWIARECFEHHALSLVEILRFGRLSADNIDDYVEIAGLEHVAEALSHGRGMIALMAHFGNWELGGATLTLKGFPVSAVARDVRSPALNELLLEQRRAVGVRTFSRQRSLSGIVSVLRQNGVLAIVPDVDTNVRGTFVDWFGSPAYTPLGPVTISRKFDAATVPVFLRRVDGMRHRLEVLPPIVWPCDGDSDDQVKANVAHYSGVIQTQIRSAPEQWIWMHDRWKTRPQDSAEGDDERAST